MSIPAYGALVAASFVLSAGGCSVVRSAARRARLVDVPNERSLHKTPVPRLGGVAIVAAVWVVLGVGSRLGSIRAEDDVRAWLVAGSVIALVGLMDDVWRLAAGIRLVVQLAAGLGLLVFLLRGRPLNLAVGLQVPPSVATLIPAVIFVVGTTNIYNFMDGMDGLAATQSVAGGVALAVAAAAAGQTDVATVASVLAAASAGFFLHNAPPASLFLGDAGSTFIGFTFGAMTFLVATRPAPVPVTVVPVALAPFLLDGTFTILRRLRRGERVWEAHRSHLYQRAVGAGRTHRDVLFVYAAWCAVSAAAAVAIGRSDVRAACAIAVGMLLPLALVWRWVVGLERGPAIKMSQ